MTARITLEIELDIDFTLEKGTGATWDYPGDPDTVTIQSIRLAGHSLPLSLFNTDELDAMEEAAFTQANTYCPVLDRY